jgi:hypothetical protein
MIAAGASVALHALWLVHEAKASHLQASQPAEVFLEAEPEPAPKALPDPPAPEDPAEKQKPALNTPMPKMAAAARPTERAAAQAGKTLTAPETPDSNAVADFSMVQGAGDMYAGGTTSSVGSSKLAVRGPASTNAVAPQHNAAIAPKETVAVDQSRGATPNGTDWNCSSLFPSDPSAGDYATVVIAVTVEASGRAKSVAIIRDPGHGFAAAARACAMMQSYRVALDRAGHPTVATTPPIVVRFTR